MNKSKNKIDKCDDSMGNWLIEYKIIIIVIGFLFNTEFKRSDNPICQITIFFKTVGISAVGRLHLNFFFLTKWIE